MARVSFTPNLQRHVDCPKLTGLGDTLADVLRDALKDHDRLKSYVLDEQFRLRQHVTVFIDDRMIVDRVSMTDPVSADSEVFVMQALSGG